ncbi:MAG: hypothetical protein ABL997_14665 [Planctomycetota bacterium]
MHCRFIVAALAALPDLASAQSPTIEDPRVADTTAAEAPAWEFSATVLSFYVPGDREYIQPIVEADRDWLHLEARFNYEGVDTGSLWAGVNFDFGSEDGLLVALTPMVGVAAGDTEGVAPGYRCGVSWQRFEFDAEGEWLFDTENAEASFFYSWSELTFAPIETLRLGVVVERTVLFESDREIQRGLLLGYGNERFDVSGVWFNPDDSDPIFVLSFGAGF